MIVPPPPCAGDHGGQLEFLDLERQQQTNIRPVLLLAHLSGAGAPRRRPRRPDYVYTPRPQDRHLTMRPREVCDGCGGPRFNSTTDATHTAQPAHELLRAQPVSPLRRPVVAPGFQEMGGLDRSQRDHRDHASSADVCVAVLRIHSAKFGANSWPKPHVREPWRRKRRGRPPRRWEAPMVQAWGRD